MRRTVPLILVVALCLVACTDPGTETVATNPGGGSPTGEEPGSTTSSSAPTFELFGRVLDSSGEPVLGTTVSTAGTSTTTGADGFFYMEAPTTGTVTAVKPGWISAEAAWDESSGLVELSLQPITVRALRVAANAAGDPEHFQRLLDLADSTAVNALVFDTKTEGGTVLYDTAVPMAHDIGAVADTYDPTELLAMADAHGLYTITRIVSFDDAIKAKAYPDQAIAGRWIDPRNRDSWQYNIDLAMEACELGFDEIQLDYIRFPSGEAVKESGQLDMTQEARVGAVASYLSAVRSVIHPMGCSVSADVFAIVVSSPNDQGIGQRPEEVSAQVDALSPMIYPSHYSNGWLGFDDPNDHPYDVTSDAIEDSLERMEPGRVLRPWLQSFWWTSAQIRRSIQAAEDLGVGWMLWNIVSDYSADSIPTDAELGG